MMTRLPDSFLPGPHDVLCGRGRACKTATGNQAYRLAVQEQLAAYQAADSKLRKGSIITGIVNRIRIQCHEYHERHHDNRRQSHGTEKDPEQKLMLGGFVKCVASTWYEVGDFLAREKTSQCFRDALSASYSSSAQRHFESGVSFQTSDSGSILSLISGRHPTTITTKHKFYLG